MNALNACGAGQEFELPPALAAINDDDDDIDAALSALDGPWHAMSPSPCPVCEGPVPMGATTCGDLGCASYAGAVALWKLDEPFGGEPMAAE
jgi:hypothetical protein